VFRIVHGSDVHFARSEFRIRDRHHRERYVNHRSYDIDTAPLCRLASLAF
jgi:cytidylate kinase